jgi:hypothetical protein
MAALDAALCHLAGPRSITQSAKNTRLQLPLATPDLVPDSIGIPPAVIGVLTIIVVTTIMTGVGMKLTRNRCLYASK